MLTKRIIPCLDVTQGRVVKGTSFTHLQDAGDPVELAAFYYKEGADELVFLDIGATPEGRDIMVDIVERVSDLLVPTPLNGLSGLWLLVLENCSLPAGMPMVSELDMTWN